MSSVYDNWERLVEATLKREHLRKIALCSSFSSSCRSYDSRSSFSSSEIYSQLADVPGNVNSNLNSQFDFGALVKELLEKPITFPHILESSILLADQAINAADIAILFKEECSVLKSQTEKLACLLLLGARASDNRDARLIISDADIVLYKALALLLKCSGKGLKRVFTIIPIAAFRKMSCHLEDSISNVSWLLEFSAGYEYCLGLPPIFCGEPIVYLVMEQIAILSMGSMEERSTAAGILVTLFRESGRYRELFIEDGGVLPLLKLMMDGESEGRENAAMAIELLLNDPVSIEQMIQADVCLMFVKMLNRGPMKVRALAAWAISKFAAHYPKCQDLFSKIDIIDLLVSHLQLRGKCDDVINADVLTRNSSNIAAVNDTENGGKDEEIETHISSPLRTTQPILEPNVVKGTMALKDINGLIQNNLGRSNSSAAVKVNYVPVLFSRASNGAQEMDDPEAREKDEDSVHLLLPGASNGAQEMEDPEAREKDEDSVPLLQSGASNGAQEMEDPDAEAYIKAMALRALSYFSKRNHPICRSIAESRTLLSIAVLLKNGPEEVRHVSTMALMEITAVAEGDAEFKAAFDPDSPACKAVVDQLNIVINKAESKLLIPCIKTIGNLAQNFKAEGTRMIRPLVNLLDKGEAKVDSEACATLAKFICPENNLHQHYSKLIISVGGVPHLVQLVYFGEEIVKKRALTVVCYIALHVPDSEDIVQALTELKWAARKSWLMEDKYVRTLLQEAEGRLSL